MVETVTQIVNRALRNLGTLASGQEASAEDTQDVGALFAPMLRALDARGVVDFYNPSTGTKDEWAADIAILLANEAAVMFGGEQNTDASAAAESRLMFMGLGPAPTINDTSGSRPRDDLIRRALQISGVLGPDRAPHLCTARGVRRLIRPLFDRLEAEDIVSVANDNSIEIRLLEPLAIMLSDSMGPPNPAGVLAARNSIRVMESGRPTYEILRANYF